MIGLKDKVLVGVVICQFLFFFEIRADTNKVVCQKTTKSSGLEMTSIGVKVYRVKSDAVDKMYSMLVDSLKLNWECSEPSFLWLSIDASGNRLSLSSNNGNGLEMAINTLGGSQVLSGFRVKNTFVLCQQMDAVKDKLSDSVVFEKQIYLPDLLAIYSSDDCNYFQCGKNKFSLMYSIHFDIKKTAVAFIRYNEFIEFGDFFMYAKKRTIKEMKKDSVCYDKLLRYRSRQYVK